MERREPVIPQNTTKAIGVKSCDPLLFVRRRGRVQRTVVPEVRRSGFSLFLMAKTRDILKLALKPALPDRAILRRVPSIMRIELFTISPDSTIIPTRMGRVSE